MESTNRRFATILSHISSPHICSNSPDSILPQLTSANIQPIMQTTKLSELIRLDGKIAIVTGGAQGIGEAISLRLAESGASVMIIDLNLEKSQRLVQKILLLGGTASCLQVDVTKLEDIQFAIKKTLKLFGKIDILINNAGIYPPMGILETTAEVWNKVLETNVSGLFYFSQETAKWMKENNHSGTIINISSVAGEKPEKTMIHYNTSKAAVDMITKCMALDLAPFNIRVNAVAPGIIWTEGVEALTLGVPRETAIKHLSEKVPVKRTGHPEDVARGVIFLSSELSSYMTGTVIVIDGGFLLT